MAELKLSAQIGRGVTSTVWQATMRSSGKQCAVKAIAKGYVYEKSQLGHVLAERELMKCIRCPFTIDFFGSFQDENHLIFMMEYVCGGDLFELASRVGVFKGPDVAFYAAQVLLGLEAIHAQNYVYRDLKPENILLDLEGFLKLADFGFAKILVDGQRAYTCCGTVEYMAPEVLQKAGSTRAADLWSLGILIFEFFAAVPPFKAGPRDMMLECMLENAIIWPENIIETGKDLIQRLLRVEEEDRIGMGPAGIDEIKRHPFFRFIKWDLLMEKKDLLNLMRRKASDEHAAKDFEEYFREF
eukprot:gene4533-5553_t